MRTLLLALALTLFGCTAARTASEDDREIRISTLDGGGVVVDDLTGAGSTVVLAGPRVTLALGEGAGVRVNDLDGADVSATLGTENGWYTWEGSYEVEIIRDEEVEGRFRIRNATMVLGRFSGSGGWANRN
jgi:hypothetical protein